MRLLTIAIRSSFVLVAGLALGACSDRGKGEDPLAQDTSLTRDLALANQDTASQPQLRDVPAETEPPRIQVAPEPAPRQRAVTRAAPPVRIATRPPAARPEPTEPAPGRTVVSASGNTVTAEAAGSERALGTVSVGSTLSFFSGQKICTNTNTVGDRFTAEIAEAVQGSNGVVIPVGATAVVEVTTLHRSERSSDNIELGLRVASVTFNGRTYPVVAEVSYAQVDRVRGESNTASDAVKGAAVGAILGQILGHRTKSTVIGAAGGAAAGAAIGAANAKVDGCVPSGGRITIRLTEPLVVQAG